MIDGVFVVDKPAGITSHDVVARLRRTVKQKRIGHSGTLDPNATGVLLVALGRATRLLRFTSEHSKSYRCNVVLGSTTSTLDADGEVLERFDMGAVTVADVAQAASRFLGDIKQVPPMVSAVKVNGKRLHELAREGIEVERKPRPVTIHAIQVDQSDTGEYVLEVACSSGTYVRTLVADIGAALGGGAHLCNLVRTSIGPFDLDNAVALDSIEESWDANLRPTADLLAHLEPLTVDDERARDVGYGRPLSVEANGAGPWRVLDLEGDLLAVYERSEAGPLTAAVVVRAA